MAWIVRVSELATKDMQPTGRFRLTATSDEDGGGPHGDTSHDHGSRAEAGSCPKCIDYCDRVTGIQTPPKTPTAEETAKARRESFRVAALPLMEWLAENANPHTVAHVDSELAELLEGALVVPREL